MDVAGLDACSTKDLAQACARQASRRRVATCEPDPCYELFRRAFAPAPDDDAWQYILNQYGGLVSFWLGQYASEDAIQEVFLRLWKAQQGAPSPFATRFPTMRAVMGYLKHCAAAVRIEAWREEERRQLLWERLRDATRLELVLAHTWPDQAHASFDYKQLILARLKDEAERAVFELTYYYDLTPAEIQAERPDLFPDVRAAHRVVVPFRRVRDQTSHPEHHYQEVPATTTTGAALAADRTLWTRILRASGPPGDNHKTIRSV